MMNPSGETSAATPAMPGRASRALLTSCIIALAVSVTLNVVLAHRVRTITGAQSARMADYQLKVGTSVPPIDAKRLGGRQDTISYNDGTQPTVLYVFTPQCVWCARNLDNFKTLLDKERSQYRFIGLSLSQEDLEQYVHKNEFAFPIYSGLPEETKRAYKLSGTPETIVVSAEGRVLQNWMGAYVGEQQKQIEEFFHVKLPGLKELPKQVANDNGQAAPPQAN